MRRHVLTPLLFLTLSVSLAIPAGASAARSLSINDESVAEPESGTTPLTFTVTLSKKHPSKKVKASYNTLSGSATPLDFEANAGKLKIKPGKTEAKVKVPIRSDLFAEPDESFSLELSDPKKATIADGEAEGTIQANDNGPDGDGDSIPDADDCDPADPNPPGALECYVPTTIYDINQGSIPAGTKAYLTNVLVTATSQNGRVGYGAIISGDPGYVTEQFSALRLDVASSGVGAGARYTLLGSTGIGSFKVDGIEDTGCCAVPPAPITLTPATLATGPDGLNGLLVKIESVSIDTATDDSWLLTDDISVNDQIYSGASFPGYGPGASFESVTGHAGTLGGGTPSLSPRNSGDLDPTTPVLQEWNGLDTCLTPGEQDVVIGELSIDEAQGTNTVIDLDAKDSGLLSVPDTVTILAGNTSVQIEADAVGTEEGSTEVEASLPPFESSLFVEVSDDFC